MGVIFTYIYIFCLYYILYHSVLLSSELFYFSYASSVKVSYYFQGRMQYFEKSLNEKIKMYVSINAKCMGA